MPKIDWRKYTDKIYVISYIENFKQREILSKEFKRIGIENYEFKYSIDNYLLYNLDSNYVIGDNLNDHVLCMTNTHYETIKEAYDIGYENIMIFEDNIMFLKDINKIKYELDNIKEQNCDISLYDYTSFDASQIKNYKGFMYQLASAYRLNRTGMEYMISRIERNLLAIDAYFTNCDRIRYDVYTNEILKFIPYYNPLNKEIKYALYDKERICIQYKINDNKIEYDRNIYDRETYINSQYNLNRIDTTVTLQESLEKYNFDAYNG